VTMFPDAGHPTQKERDEQGPIGDHNHSRPCPAQGGVTMCSVFLCPDCSTYPL
jgi:hypothetical protein